MWTEITEQLEVSCLIHWRREVCGHPLHMFLVLRLRSRKMSVVLRVFMTASVFSRGYVHSGSLFIRWPNSNGELFLIEMSGWKLLRLYLELDTKETKTGPTPSLLYFNYMLEDCNEAKMIKYLLVCYCIILQHMYLTLLHWL